MQPLPIPTPKSASICTYIILEAVYVEKFRLLVCLIICLACQAYTIIYLVMCEYALKTFYHSRFCL